MSETTNDALARDLASINIPDPEQEVSHHFLDLPEGVSIVGEIEGSRPGRWTWVVRRLGRGGATRYYVVREEDGELARGRYRAPVTSSGLDYVASGAGYVKSLDIVRRQLESEIREAHRTPCDRCDGGIHLDYEAYPDDGHATSDVGQRLCARCAPEAS